MILLCAQCGTTKPYRVEGTTWILGQHDCPKTTVMKFSDWPDIERQP